MTPISRSLLCIVLVAAPAMAQDYGVQVEHPFRVVSKTPFEVTVIYTAPATPTRLNCELKRADNVVFDRQTADVAGQGRHTFTLTAPDIAQLSEFQAACWMGTDWRTPVGGIVHTPTIRVLSEGEHRRLVTMESSVPDELRRLGYTRSAAGTVAVFEGVTDPARKETDSIARGLADQGLTVVRLDAAAMANPYLVTPEYFNLLVLAHPRRFPASSVEVVAQFAERGGNLMVLGGPAFEKVVWPYANQWFSSDELSLALAQAGGQQVFWSFDGDLPAFSHAANKPTALSSIARETPGALGTAGCAHLAIRDLDGWDTFGADASESGFPEGHELTCFSARSTTGTSSMVVEWVEADGSRWMAVVPLFPEWTRYALPLSQFAYWHDSPTPGRGGVGDHLNPRNARRLGFGLAFTHTTTVARGDHDILIDEVATAPVPEDLRDFANGVQNAAVPQLQGVSPKYKTYPIASIERLDVVNADLWPDKPPVPESARGIHPRPKGTGIHKNRRWRFIPVIDAIGEHGKSSGAVAALILDSSAPYQGASMFSMPVEDPKFLADPRVLRGLAHVARRMMDGCFLYEGGSEFYAYQENEPVRLGAEVVNRGKGEADCRVVVTVVDDGGKELFRREEPVRCAAGADERFETTFEPRRLTGTDYSVRTELLRDGEVIDRLEHPLTVWRPSAEPSFITTRGGDFYLDGRKWYAHGVNYMPSSGVGEEDGPYFEFWLDPQPYDPDVIERDLSDIEDIGMNMVSVFIYRRSADSRNLWDLLTRCERHGIKVNLSLRPGTPMDFLWDQMRELIEKNRLAESDTVFAYDLAWEPFFGPYAGRSQWDGNWVEWIAARFGSVEAAEREWGMPVPRTAEGKVTGPSDGQLGADGDWRKMVAAYRRFVDDLSHAKYGEARRLVRSVDPDHLVSFRMTMAGDPGLWQGLMPFDFRGLSGAVDIMEPEGYGRIGDWERVKPGMFTVAYARAVAPETPLMWAEFGVHAWDTERMEVSQAGLDFQGKFYRDFYEMAFKSGANGTVCWWFPGGYRCGERSDYGILNPDRTWRPSTQAIHDWADRLKRERDIPRPEVRIEVSRDAYANGVSGIYESVGERFFSVVDEGRTPGLVWTDEP